MSSVVWLFGILIALQDLPRFEDVTTASGLTGVGSGRASFADLDADGWTDLVVDGQVYLNQNGKFTSIKLNAPGGGCIIFDVNNDGNLDLYFLAAQGSLYLGDGKGKFRKSDIGPNSYNRAQGAAAADIDKDGWVDLYVANFEDWKNNTYPFPDVLYKNSKGRPSITWTSPPDKVMPARGATFCDFDQDGDMDLYVSNYRLAPNILWVNDGKGKFSDKAVEFGVAGRLEGKGDIVNGHGLRYKVAGHTIGSAWADFDNDGWFDILVGNFSHPPETQDRVQLLKNEGGKKFTDRSADARIRWQESYCGTCCGDLDNDGRIDLFIPAIYPKDRGVFYRNQGEWRFSEAAVGIEQKESYQAAFADVDNDGNLDAMIGGRLYRNTGSKNGWVKVVLSTKKTNRFAVGARVVCRDGQRTQVRQVEAGTGSGNMNDLTLHFGVGSASEVELDIFWPDGKKETQTCKVKTTAPIEQK